MKPAYQRAIDAAFSVLPQMWSVYLGIDLMQKPRSWSGIALDVAMIVLLTWAVRKSAKMERKSP